MGRTLLCFSGDLVSGPTFGTPSFHNLGKQSSVTRMWVTPDEGALGFDPGGSGRCQKGFKQRRHISRCVLSKILSAEPKSRQDDTS